MKILFFTDTHIRGTNPKNRVDDFTRTLENKLNEIIFLIDDLEIDYVIHGGDLFDRPDLSVSVVSNFARILKKVKVPFYIVCGNHDIFGHNPKTIDRTMLGLLSSLDFMEIIKEDEAKILRKNGLKVHLTGQPYVYDIDSDFKGKYILEDINEGMDFSIHVVHGMLLDRPFVKGIPFTLIDDIKQTKADITLSGHYHAGFKTQLIDGKYFINPGSLARVTNSLEEISRTPKVVLIELNKSITINLIELKSAEKGDKVLNRDEIEKHIFKGEQLSQFKQIVESSSNFEKMDINDLLIEVSSSEGISSEIKEEALRRIAEIHMKDTR